MECEGVLMRYLAGEQKKKKHGKDLSHLVLFLHKIKTNKNF